MFLRHPAGNIHGRRTIVNMMRFALLADGSPAYAAKSASHPGRGAYMANIHALIYPIVVFRCVVLPPSLYAYFLVPLADITHEAFTIDALRGRIVGKA